MEDLLELDATNDQQDDAENTDDQQQEGEQQEGEQEQETEKTPVTSLFQADGKKLDPQVSSTLAKIKTENPDLGKLLTGWPKAGEVFPSFRVLNHGEETAV